MRDRQGHELAGESPAIAMKGGTEGMQNDEEKSQRAKQSVFEGFMEITGRNILLLFLLVWP